MVPVFGLIQGHAGACRLFDDDSGGLGPFKALRVGVVLGRVVVDGGLLVVDALEDAAADALVGYLGEEAFDEVQPGRGFWNKVQLETRMLFKPGSTSAVLWVVNISRLNG